MLQSSNNGNDLIYYDDQQDCSRPFFNDIRHDHQEQPPPPPPLTPLSFFPSPCIPYDHLELQDYDNFLHQNQDLLLHQHHPHHHHHQQLQQPQSLTRSFASDHTVVDVKVKEDATNYKKSQNNSNTSVEHYQGLQRKQIPKKRSSKRDRHSKINTAQGPRDRRMRLSLKVAREFFGLQDKLCFDKASNTVEWLLIQSRQAIKKLCADGDGDGDGGGHLPPNNCSCTSTLPSKSASSTSECEVVSEIDEAAATKASISKTTKPSSSSGVNGLKRAKPSRRTALFHPLARESREKARERARERTKEKKKLCIGQKIMPESKLCDELRNQELNQLCSWSSPFENSTTGDRESGNNNNTVNPCSDMQLPMYSSPERDRLALASPSENMGKWSPSPIFNHLYNSGILQENPITDLQYLYMQVMGGL